MSVIELGAISLALALDAFSVALSLGFDRRINRRNAVFFIISFGFFQFFFVFIGGFGGELFNRYVFALPSFIGGIIIAFVGILMVKEGLSETEKLQEIHWVLIIVLGMCVSIDALVVGFSSFNVFHVKTVLFESSLVVGVITSFLTTLAFAISRNMRRIDFIKKYADFLGGFILILFGLKMILF